jgi:tetratricopeptide (TPR) repeat protein
MPTPRLCLALTIGCLLLQTGCHKQPPASYEELMKQARAMLKDGNLAEAKAKADDAAGLDPKRYDAFGIRFIIAIRQDDREAARSALAKAIALAPAEKKGTLEALQKKLLAHSSTRDGPPAAPASTGTTPSAGKVDGALEQGDRAVEDVTRDLDKTSK